MSYNGPALIKRISLFLLPLLFFTTGVLHFFSPEAFVKIAPPFLPVPRLLVYLSGACELAGAAGLLLPQLRRYAAWGLVLLLVAIFPANIYMAIDRVQVTSWIIPEWLLWARLPLQGLLIWWILWAVKASRRTSSV